MATENEAAAFARSGDVADEGATVGVGQQPKDNAARAEYNLLAKCLLLDQALFDDVEKFSSTELRILRCVLRRIDSVKGTAWLSHTDIARLAEVDKRKSIRTINRFLDAKPPLLLCEKKGAGRHRSCYRMPKRRGGESTTSKPEENPC